MMRHGLWLGAVALLLGCCVAMPEAEAQFPVWVLSSLERAGIEDTPGSSTSAALFAARGEFEAFQIVIKAPQDGLKQVQVSASPLVQSGHGVIENEEITLYREHYVYVNRASPDWRGSNRPLGSGWYPDPLIPIPGPEATFDVPGGRNQPIWVDILVPRDAPSGQYRGAVTITTDQGAADIPVSVNVWDFELPLKPSLKSSFGYSRPSQPKFEELLRHKVMPQRVAAPGSQSPVERDLIERMGLAATDLGFWSGADRSTCAMRSAPAAEQLASAALARDPDLYLFNYTADEIDDCPNLLAPMVEWARAMHRAGVRNLVVMAPTPELFDDGLGTGRSVVDIWVVLPKMYDDHLRYVAQALRKGDEVWSYNTLAQDSYSPKWLIDYEPINFRIQPGFISQSLQLTGLLYWTVDRWPSDPWNDANNQGVFGAGNYPGEGMLLYPGEPIGIAGVAPSIRLKQLREGIEDYEYVEMLKQLGWGDWALAQARTLAPDWTNWTRDREVLETVRRRLGEQIHQLAQRSDSSR